MIEAARSTFCSNVAAAARVARAAGAARRTAEIARAIARLFAVIWTDEQAIDEPRSRYFGTVTSTSAERGPGTPPEEIEISRYTFFDPLGGVASIAEVASCGKGPWIS